MLIAAPAAATDQDTFTTLIAAVAPPDRAEVQAQGGVCLPQQRGHAGDRRIRDDRPLWKGPLRTPHLNADGTLGVVAISDDFAVLGH